MNEVKVILTDDIHLEGREEQEQKQFADLVNQQIYQIKEAKDIPIVVCAGDIGEGLLGVKWASQLNCEVIYVCGNHEFWNGDLYDINQEIQHFVSLKENSHIKYLSNNTIILHDIRFIGSTLWTSLGDYLPWYNKNYIIKYYMTMGDFKRSYAEKWYTPENEERLFQFLSANGVEREKIKDLIFNKNFNPLIEREEHLKALEYIIGELGKPFNGKTVIVSHHLPVFQTWMKKKEMKEEDIEGEYINNEKRFYEAMKGGDDIAREVLMMGYYTNDLIDLMYGELAPDYWLHGHLHIPMMDLIGKTQIISSPVGYKRQSTTMSYKILDIENTEKLLKEYLLKDIEESELFKKGTDFLQEFKNSIIQFETAIETKLLIAHDFQPILKIFKTQHKDYLKELKRKVTQWLQLLVYYQNNKIEQKEIDYFIALNLSGLTTYNMGTEKMTNGRYHFPDELSCEINSASFSDDVIQNNKNLSHKEWIKDLEKIQNQIQFLKKY